MRDMRLARSSGFSLVELITIIVVVGILSAVAGPLLGNSKQTYDDLGFYDGTRAILRFAQKAAIAQRRTVCVAFAAASVTLTVATAAGSAACNANLIGPGGQNPYTIAAVSSTFAPTPANFTFNTLGQPSLGQVITITGVGVNITVNADTGYVQ